MSRLPQEGVLGLLERSIPGVGDEPEFRYLVQLPPEYDPSRRYPCIVTLHGGGSTPQGQIDWWAGPWDAEKKLRTGQATRRGYFVIAPLWAADEPDASTSIRCGNMRPCSGRCATPVAISASIPIACS